MIKASMVLALIGLCVLAASLSGAVGVPFYLPLSTLVLAGIVFAGRDIPKFLRIFLVMLSGTHLVLVALILGATAGAITGDYTGYVPPPSAALGATAFVAIIFGLSYVPVVRTICRLAFPGGGKKNKAQVTALPVATGPARPVNGAPVRLAG